MVFCRCTKARQMEGCSSVCDKETTLKPRLTFAVVMSLTAGEPRLYALLSVYRTAIITRDRGIHCKA